MNKQPTQFCEIGDHVRFIKRISIDGSDAIEVGDTYEATDLIGWGWDLKRRSGNGPALIRLLNSEMKDRVVKIETDSA